MRANISRRVFTGALLASAFLPSTSRAQNENLKASPEATPASVEYPPLPEIRDIQSRPWSLDGVKFSISGEVGEIFIAPDGMGWELGDDEEYMQLFQTKMTLGVEFPNGGIEWLLIGYADDPGKIYEGDFVTVGGERIGTVSGENTFGAESTWQLIAADYIHLATPQT